MKAIISLSSLVMCALALSGCTTGVISPPEGSPTMSQAYAGAMQNNTHVSGDSPESVSYNKTTRVTLPTLAGALQSPQILAQQAEDNQQFPLLPNPQIMMYIYPHFEGVSQMPVHGLWTTFPMYAVNHYALPQEIQNAGVPA